MFLFTDVDLTRVDAFRSAAPTQDAAEAAGAAEVLVAALIDCTADIVTDAPAGHPYRRNGELRPESAVQLQFLLPLLVCLAFDHAGNQARLRAAGAVAALQALVDRTDDRFSSSNRKHARQALAWLTLRPATARARFVHAADGLLALVSALREEGADWLVQANICDALTPAAGVPERVQMSVFEFTAAPVDAKNSDLATELVDLVVALLVANHGRIDLPDTQAAVVATGMDRDHPVQLQLCWCQLLRHLITGHSAHSQRAVAAGAVAALDGWITYGHRADVAPTPIGVLLLRVATRTRLALVDPARLAAVCVEASHGLPAILAALRAYPDDRDVVAAAATALGHAVLARGISSLVADRGRQTEAVALGALDALVAAMQAHLEHGGTQFLCCHALTNVLESNVGAMVPPGVRVAVAHAATLPEAATKATELLAWLDLDPALARARNVVAGEDPAVLAEALAAFPTDATVRERALIALSAAYGSAPTDAIREALGAAGVFVALVAAVQALLALPAPGQQLMIAIGLAGGLLADMPSLMRMPDASPASLPVHVANAARALDAGLVEVLVQALTAPSLAGHPVSGLAAQSLYPLIRNGAAAQARARALGARAGLEQAITAFGRQLPPLLLALFRDGVEKLAEPGAAQ